MAAKLPPELQAPTDETSYALLFARKKQQWLLWLWSNQVMSCVVKNAPPLAFVAERTYKFRFPEGTKLETKGFYAAGVPSKEQRRRAVAEYEKQLRARLGEGFELVADSRILEKRAKLRNRPKVLPAAKVAKLAPWPALVYWGTVYGASDDARVVAVAEACEKATEAEVRFAALKRLPKTSEKVVLRGDVADRAFKGKLLWVRGDLHVKGNLELGVSLMVSGDLVVDGVLSDAREWTQILVGGSVKAGAIDMGSQLFAGGAIEAELVVIDGTGELSASKGLRTKLLVEEGYDHHVRGKVGAAHRVDFTKDAERGVATLEKLLVPKLGAAIREELEAKGEEFYFPKRVVVEAWRAKGAKVWA